MEMPSAPSPEWIDVIREFGLPTFLVLVFTSLFVWGVRAAWKFYQPLKQAEHQTRNAAMATLAASGQMMAENQALSARTLERVEQSLTANFGKLYDKHEALHRDVRSMRCVEDDNPRRSWPKLPHPENEEGGS